MRSSVDDISADDTSADDTVHSPQGQLPPNLRETCEAIIQKVTTDLSMSVHEISWISDRLEIIIANLPTNATNEGTNEGSDSPDPEQLTEIHRRVYETFELDKQLAFIPERYEV